MTVILTTYVFQSIHAYYKKVFYYYSLLFFSLSIQAIQKDTFCVSVFFFCQVLTYSENSGAVWSS
jgi:hypothetical protein